MQRQVKRTKHARVRTEHSAGGVVFRRGRRGIELGFILDPFHKWTFPKGHVDPGETVIAAALRETHEEMGIRGKIRVIAPLGTTSIWFRDRFVHKGALVHKYITYFLIEASSGITVRPQKSEKIRAVRWVDFRRASRFVSYKNMQRVVGAAVKYLYGLQTSRLP